MAANYTANYNLCQWEATDQVQRTDFNQDNAKIDAALKELSIAEAVPDLAFYLGQIGITRLKEGKSRLLRDMICEAFMDSDGLTLSGGAVIQNHVLTLSGSQTGTLTTQSYMLMKNWTHARAWIHVSSGTAYPSIDGQAMSPAGGGSSHTIDGVFCNEHRFTLDVESGNDWPSLKLDLVSYEGATIQVYDYCVFFF